MTQYEQMDLLLEQNKGMIRNAARGTEQYLQDATDVFDEVKNDVGMKKLWQAYQKKFSYASDIPWEEVMQSMRALHQKAVFI